jgi:hypothetical protein
MVYDLSSEKIRMQPVSTGRHCTIESENRKVVVYSGRIII